jgi:hypothetical protein
MLLNCIAKLLPQKILQFIREFAKEQLPNEYELMGFAELEIDDPNRTIFLIEHHDLLIRCETYPDNSGIVKYWSVSQQAECLFCLVGNGSTLPEAKHQANEWANSYIEKRKQLLWLNVSKRLQEKDIFLFSHSTFTVLCTVSQEITNEVYWSVYDKNNTFISIAGGKCSTITEAAYAGYWWIDEYKSRDPRYYLL